MHKRISLAFIAGGIVLLVFGMMAVTSSTSDYSRMLTGAPTDLSMWLLGVGVLVEVLGVAGILRHSG